MWDLNRRAFAEAGLEKLATLELIESIPSDRTAFEMELAFYSNPVELEKLSVEEMPRVTRRLEEFRRLVADQFDKKESDWTWEERAEETEYLAPLSWSMNATWLRAIVIRTKLRLLSATAKALLHEVRNYKLPDSLTDAHDPTTGTNFFYGKRDDAFVLYSQGTEKTGQIELGTLWVRPR
jgi:hypothetical protein